MIKGPSFGIYSNSFGSTWQVMLRCFISSSANSIPSNSDICEYISLSLLTPATAIAADATTEPNGPFTFRAFLT